ncbi:MAG: hypothetical protein V4581_18550 [Bacteroidota bacterium]
MDDTENAVHEGNYFFDLFITWLPIVVLFIVIYAIVRLYIKLSRYLDRNTPKQ